MNLKLIEFIKNNNDWENKLSQSPYNLKIEKDDGYILFKYDQVHSDFSLDIVKEARGIILRENDFQVVCFPFYKFFNVDETYADNIDWNNICVEEKIDGSLIKVWFDGGMHISTNGMIDAFKAQINSLCRFNNFGELFVSQLNNEIISNMNTNNTYLFELVSPYTKVVVDYPEIKIYHIGTRNNLTGKEINEDIGVDKPKVYSLKTELEIREAAQNLPFNEEGYVVVDKDYHRVKIKSPAYVNAHRLINNHEVNIEKALELIIGNDDEEFLCYFPEYKNEFEKLKNKYNELIKSIEREYNKVKSLLNEFLTRKDFAIYVRDNIVFKDMAFLIYDNKIQSFQDYFEKLTIKKIIERINEI